MKKRLSNSQFKALLATIVLAAITQTACTKTADTGTVRLIMPGAVSTTSQKSKVGSATSQSVSASSGGNSWNSGINPTTGSDINCFAVFIGGGDLTTNSCTIGTSAADASTIKFGPNVGFVPAGGEISIVAPTGSRVIYVVGLHSATAAACSNYSNSQPDSGNLSDPFLIASKATTIASGTSSVSVSATLDLTKKVLDCQFFGNGNGGGQKLFGDKRDGGITATASPNMFGGSSTLTTVTTRTGTSTLPNSKIFAASRRITGIATSGTDAGVGLTLGSAFTTNEFEVGDEVVWYVAGGVSSLGSPDDPVLGACGGQLYLGRYGTARIKTVTSTTQLTLDQSISGTPATLRSASLSAPPTSSNYCTIVLSRVSSFDVISLSGGYNLTMDVEAFNYTNGTGGILMVRAETVSIGSGSTLALSGSSKGYVGGLASGSIFQGDGLNAAGIVSGSANYNGGAPGTISTVGGGGGGHGGIGGAGGAAAGMGMGSALNHCQGSAPCSPLVDQKAFFGGGGGGAGSSAAGGAGGGLVILYARNVTGTGTLSISSSGGVGMSGGAGAGGGAGGAIGFYSQTATVSNLALDANGGNGGTGTFGGGGGGGGVINVVRCLANFTSPMTYVANLGAGGGGGANSGSVGVLNLINDAAACVAP